MGMYTWPNFTDQVAEIRARIVALEHDRDVARGEYVELSKKLDKVLYLILATLLAATLQLVLR